MDGVGRWRVIEQCACVSWHGRLGSFGEGHSVLQNQRLSDSAACVPLKNTSHRMECAHPCRHTVVIALSSCRENALAMVKMWFFEKMSLTGQRISAQGPSSFISCLTVLNRFRRLASSMPWNVAAMATVSRQRGERRFATR